MEQIVRSFDLSVMVVIEGYGTVDIFNAAALVCVNVCA